MLPKIENLGGKSALSMTVISTTAKLIQSHNKNLNAANEQDQNLENVSYKRSKQVPTWNLDRKSTSTATSGRGGRGGKIGTVSMNQAVVMPALEHVSGFFWSIKKNRTPHD